MISALTLQVTPIQFISTCIQNGGIAMRIASARVVATGSRVEVSSALFTWLWSVVLVKRCAPIRLSCSCLSTQRVWSELAMKWSTDPQCMCQKTKITLTSQCHSTRLPTSTTLWSPLTSRTCSYLSTRQSLWDKMVTWHWFTTSRQIHLCPTQTGKRLGCKGMVSGKLLAPPIQLNQRSSTYLPKPCRKHAIQVMIAP